MWDAEAALRGLGVEARAFSETENA